MLNSHFVLIFFLNYKLKLKLKIKIKYTEENVSKICNRNTYFKLRLNSKLTLKTD